MAEPTSRDLERSEAERSERRNRIGVIVSLVCVVLGPPLGFLVTNLLVQRSLRAATNVDASDKARILAQGISEAMNGFLFGLGVSVVAGVAAVVFGMRFARARRAGVAKRPG